MSDLFRKENPSADEVKKMIDTTASQYDLRVLRSELLDFVEELNSLREQLPCSNPDKYEKMIREIVMDEIKKIKVETKRSVWESVRDALVLAQLFYIFYQLTFIK